ncbi:cytochrome P450 [Durotheca rogersii]|uniref:cytochrome P450 n=1 Tax=Durotheca rogersii TaxID=419775 RepID=UPI00221F2B0B|nr:cytochrome P450 [Durotheca rogersii]KAI5857355.1 cytochrome P450 [Durotheca rogersii]
MALLVVCVEALACLLSLFLLNRLVRSLSNSLRCYYARTVQGMRYLLAGPNMIDQAYVKARGASSFKVPTPSNDHLMITSSELIKEVLDAPHDSLSLHAVAKELLQPKYTMCGFEWQNQRGVEGTGFVRALRSRLTSHLPHFQPELDKIIRGCLDEELKKQGEDGFSRAKLFPMIKRIVTKVNCFVFFGKDLSENAEFTAAALEFPQIVVLTAELLRITPEFLCPLVASIATHRHRAAGTLFRYLEPVVRQRLADRAESDSSNGLRAAPTDCVQWLIETSPRKNPWSTGRMIGEIMAIWFSSVHQLAITITYVVEDLCLQGAYVDPLREEIDGCLEGRSSASIDTEKLPLLDSFVKESVRYSNADAISCRRKALQDYVLKDGSALKKNDWVCIPQRAMMCDAQRYSNPHHFDGFRFARANEALRQGATTTEVPDKSPSSLTATGVEWPIWGMGNTACPGRFYASLVLKLLVVQILDEWECKMPDTTSPRTMFWRSSMVPLESTVVMFRKRHKMTAVVSVEDAAKDASEDAAARVVAAEAPLASGVPNPQ